MQDQLAEQVLAYCAGQDWNSLPLSIRKASDIAFKSALKQYYIDHDHGLIN